MWTSPLRAYRTGGMSMPSRMLLGVRPLQPLRDLLQPTQLRQTRARDHRPASEREPRFERAREESQPGRARRVHLRPRAPQVTELGVEPPIAGLEFDRAADVREAEQRATGLDVLERGLNSLGRAGRREDPQHQVRYVVPGAVGLRPRLRFVEHGDEPLSGHAGLRSLRTAAGISVPR